MNEPDVVITAYSTWLEAILETHSRQLWDTAEDELDDEQLNADWDVLPERLRRRLWGLSADLFSLVDNEKFVDADWQPISEPEQARLLEASFQNREWDELLELLRRPLRFVTPDQLSYIRGRAWQELGEHHVALKFLDNACRLKSGYVPYRILALECLKRAGGWDEAIRRAHQYALDPTSPPSLLFRAADVLHARSMEHVPDASQMAERAVELVNMGIEKLAESRAELPLDSTLAAAYFTKANCLEQLGRVEDAFLTYDAAILRFPHNAELLTARGLLGLEHRRETSCDDFRRAVEFSAQSVWPYLELARHDYDVHRHDAVIELCQLGLARTNRDSDAALLYDLLALALFGKNDMAAAAKAFQIAASLDPFNLAIRHNHSRFLALATRPDEPVADGWEFSRLPIDVERRFLYQVVRSTLPLAA